MIEIERRILRKFSGGGIRAALKPDMTLSELFHENTKLTPWCSRAYGAWIGQVGRSKTLTSLMAQAHKLYSLRDRVSLAAPTPTTYLERAIMARRSIRRFTGEAMTKDELTRLLFFSYGKTDRRRNYRAVPSGGALYPLELYAIVLNVDDLSPGIYHYDVEGHELDVVSSVNQKEALKDCMWVDDIHVDDAGVVIVVTALFERCTLKYKDRGYRMVMMEAGEVAQTLMLLGTTQGLGSCLVGGFHDDRLSQVLGIDGCDEAPLLPLVVGRMRGTTNAEPDADRDW